MDKLLISSFNPRNGPLFQSYPQKSPFRFIFTPPEKPKREKKRRRAARAPRVREPNGAKERLCGKAPALARHKRAPASGQANEPPTARERRKGRGPGPGAAKASVSERGKEHAPKGGRLVSYPRLTGRAV